MERLQRCFSSRSKRSCKSTGAGFKLVHIILLVAISFFTCIGTFVDKNEAEPGQPATPVTFNDPHTATIIVVATTTGLFYSLFDASRRQRSSLNPLQPSPALGLDTWRGSRNFRDNQLAIGKIVTVLCWSTLCLVVSLFFHVEHEISLNDSQYGASSHSTRAPPLRLAASWGAPSLEQLELMLPRLTYALSALVLIMCVVYPGFVLGIKKYMIDSSMTRSESNAVGVSQNLRSQSIAEGVGQNLLPLFAQQPAFYHDVQLFLIVMLGTLLFPTMLLLRCSNIVPFGVSIIQLPLLFSYFCSRLPPVYSPSKPTGSISGHQAMPLRKQGQENSDSLYILNDSTVVTLSMMAGALLFYNTGHRSTITAVPVAAAFVGVNEFNLLWSGILVFLHTFISFVIALVTAALAVAMRTSSENLILRLAKAILCVLGVVSLRNFASQVSVIVLRRHLVAWTVFAPRYLYDSQLLIVTHIVGFFIMACLERISALRTIKPKVQ